MAGFALPGVNSAPVMQLGSIEAIKRMVRAGLGYSIVPKMAVAAEDDRTGIRVQSLSPRLYRQLGVVMRQDKVINKGIAEMLRLLHQLKKFCRRRYSGLGSLVSREHQW